MRYNNKIQICCDIPLQLIVYTEKRFARLNTKRFLIKGQKGTQNIWIPNAYLEPDGTIRADANLAWLFAKHDTRHKLELEGITIDQNNVQNKPCS